MTDTEAAYSPPDDDEIIVEGELMPTRAAYPNAKEMTDFYMNGINNGTQKWTIQNLGYTKNPNTGVWKGKKTFSWPAVPITLSFFAVNPSFGIFDTSKSIVSYEKVSMYYTMSANAADQTDILYGSMLFQDRNTNNKKVQFTFKHGVSYQRFKGQNSLGDRYDVIIKSITLCRVRPAGSMEYNLKTANKISWTIDTEVPHYNTIIEFKDNSGNDGVTLAAKADFLSSTDYLLTLPQNLTLWKTKGTMEDHVSIEDAIDNNLHYWEVKAKIFDKQESKYLLGNANNDDPESPEWGTVYMQPTQKAWQLGSTYLNTVNITTKSLFTKGGINFFDDLENNGGEGVEIIGAENINSIITTEEWGYEEDELDLQLDADAENN